MAKETPESPKATPTPAAAPAENPADRARPPAPPYRRLRIYAFDPSLDLDLDTALINAAVVKVPWERDPDSGANLLGVGPVGEYLEVIDVDPGSGCFYAPVDLNDPHLLAQDGYAPSEGNPQFHQQMVYAVAMMTIRNFEKALGRLAQWSPRRYSETKSGRDEFVRRLRIYPHALRQENAFYSPAKKALLFGYFPARPKDRREHMPDGMVFSCLSHDIIAHETTHALLDGLHRRYLEPSNPDVLAFHEGFADIVA
ncbi:MAG: S8 family serine peptidase, partial [Gemmataceae bacterium]